MGYVVLRVAKIKSRASLMRAAQHHTRERMPENADPERSARNFGDKSAAAVMARYDALKPEKIRKNAVHAVEFVLSASPAALQAIGPERSLAFFKAARDWAQKRIGGAQNTLCWALHQDELSPHLHVVMMPMQDGKLNARGFIGGHRDVLRQMQTEFAEEVGAQFGLERGIPKDQTLRQHRPVREYYAKVNQIVLEERKRQAARQLISQERIQKIKARKRDEGGLDL